MNIHKLVLRGDIEVNCFIIEHAGECFIVDPGYEKQKIVTFVRQRGLEPIGILLTHAHLDHIGAVDCFELPVHLHEADLGMLKDDLLNGFAVYGQQKPFSLESLRIAAFSDAEAFPIGDAAVTALHTPGHTAGSVCYLAGEDMLSGDTLFAGGVGRWDFPSGDMQALSRSIVMLVDSQNESVRVHPGHGPSSTIGKEKKSNPYYREWKAAGA